MPVELFVTGTGAGISGANTGGAGTGIFPCQRPTPRGEVQRWTGELIRGVGGDAADRRADHAEPPK